MQSNANCQGIHTICGRSLFGTTRGEGINSIFYDVGSVLYENTDRHTDKKARKQKVYKKRQKTCKFSKIHCKTYVYLITYIEKHYTKNYFTNNLNSWVYGLSMYEKRKHDKTHGFTFTKLINYLLYTNSSWLRKYCCMYEYILNYDTTAICKYTHKYNKS